MDVEGDTHIDPPAEPDIDEAAAEFDRECLQGETLEITLDSDDDEPPIEDAMDCEEGRGEDDRPAIVDESEYSMQHTDSVLSCAIRRGTDPLEVCSGGMDDVAIIWTAGSEKIRLEGHTDSVASVAYSHDCEYIATGSMDATVRIWNAETGAHVSTCEGPTMELEWSVWHPKGHVVLAGSADMTVWMWWAPTGKVMQVFGGHGGVVTSGTFTTSGKAIITGADDGGVIIWNPKEGTAHHTLSPHRAPVVSLCPSPNEACNVVVSGAADGSCLVLHVESGKQLHRFSGHDAGVEAIGFSHPEALVPLLATGDLNGRLSIWDAQSYEVRVTVAAAHSDGIIALQWVMERKADLFLVTCSNDATSKLWDGRNGTALRTFIGHQHLPVLDICTHVVGDELVVASASDDDTCKIFRYAL